jgi:hypothetical protein
MWASKVVKSKGLYQKIISTPRHLSSDCGYSLKIKLNDEDSVRVLISENSIEYLGIFALSDQEADSKAARNCTK